MTLFVSEPVPLKPCQFARRVQLLPDTNYLVTAEGNRLIIWTLNEQRPYLVSASSIVLGSRIAHLTSYYYLGQKERIVALVENELVAIALNEDFTHSKVTIPLAVVRGALGVLETGLLLYCYRSDEVDYLVLYRYAGFITIVDLSLALEPKRDRVKQKNFKDRTSKTFCIGEFTVVLMAIVGSSPHLAVLYRDVDFNYSLRYYALLKSSNTLTVTRQMETFQGVPTHVYALKNGLVVASDTKLFFFPAPSKTVTLSEHAGDTTLSVTTSKVQKIVTLNMSELSATYLGCKFNCSTAIDDKRQMLFSDRGDTLLVYLETRASSSEVEVIEFKVVALQKSTVALLAAHLGQNIFFASSTVSRSILFRVLQKSPFIDVIETVANNLPVISISTIPSGYSHDLLVARGGFNSGEINIISTAKTTAKHIKSISVCVDNNKLDLAKIGSYRIVRLKAEGVIGECYDFPCLHKKQDIPFIKDSEAKPSKEGVWRFGSVSIKFDKEQATIRNAQQTQTVDLPGFCEASDVIYVDNGGKSIFAALWEGRVIQIRLKKQAEVVLDPLIKSRLSYGIRTRLALIKTSNNSFVLAILFHGSLLQIEFENHQRGLETSREPVSVLGFLHFFQDEAPEQTIYMHDAFRLYRFERLENSCFFEPRVILRSKSSILDCKSSDPHLIVLFSNGVLSHFELESELPYASYFSNGLIKNAVPVGEKYIVGLELEEKPNRMTGRIDISSRLLLFDQCSLRLLDLYLAPDKLIVDVSAFGIIGDSTFVTAYSNVSAETTILVHEVKDDKICSPYHYKAKGAFPTSNSIVKMSVFKRHIALCGTSMIKLSVGVTTSDGEPRSWVGKTFTSQKEMVYGVDAAFPGNGDRVFYADLSRGIFASQKESDTLFPLPLVNPPSYVSSLAACHEQNILIYGDSMGNIAGTFLTSRLDQDSFRCNRLFSVNIDDPINVICMVLEAPLCLMVGTVSGRLLKFQEADITPSDGCDLLEKFFLSCPDLSFRLHSWRNPEGNTATSEYSDVSGDEAIDVVKPFNVSFASSLYSMLDSKSFLNLSLVAHNLNRSY